MTARSPFSACEYSDLVELFAIDALSAGQQTEFGAHLDECSSCRRELKSLQPVVESLAAWPGSEFSPQRFLWQRLATTLGLADLVAKPFVTPPELDSNKWEQPAPGIYSKILSDDRQFSRVSMLVKLNPGVAYPPHTHAGAEELHLLDGELWIDDRRLVPGDYYRAEPGTTDRRVWSGTGCTCVLITSPADVLRPSLHEPL